MLDSSKGVPLAMTQGHKTPFSKPELARTFARPLQLGVGVDVAVGNGVEVGTGVQVGKGVRVGEGVQVGNGVQVGGGPVCGTGVGVSPSPSPLHPFHTAGRKTCIEPRLEPGPGYASTETGGVNARVPPVDSIRKTMIARITKRRRKRGIWILRAAGGEGKSESMPPAVFTVECTRQQTGSQLLRSKVKVETKLICFCFS